MKNTMLVLGLMSALLLSSVGSAFAKVEGAGGGVVSTCSPISGLTVKGDPTVGEIGFASVQMGWSVKPCDKNQAVVVVATIINWKSGEVIYDDQDAGLNGKLSVFVPARQIYNCTITVLDAATGDVIQVKTLGVSTTPKGV